MGSLLRVCLHALESCLFRADLHKQKVLHCDAFHRRGHNTLLRHAASTAYTMAPSALIGLRVAHCLLVHIIWVPLVDKLCALEHGVFHPDKYH